MEPCTKAANANSQALGCGGEEVQWDGQTVSPLEETNETMLEVTPLLIAETQVRGLSRLVQQLTIKNAALNYEMRHAEGALSQAENYIREERRLHALVSCLNTTNVEVRRLLNEANEGIEAAQTEKECTEAELEGVRESLNRLQKAEEELTRELDRKKQENEDLRVALRAVEQEVQKARGAFLPDKPDNWALNTDGQGQSWQATLKPTNASSVARILSVQVGTGESLGRGWLW